ncbi:MAG: TlpA family protein disulfide reductase [Bacteroidetes bacterium]|nr:TlpA family protein disulfide reductase [Bacteroidota bacterium]
MAYQQEIAATVALSIPTKESVLINQKNKRITFDSLIKQNKGKVLYIDFWASWCVPCIQQIPSSLALQKDFQNLPIQFYYISLDKSSSSYKEMSTQLKLPNHEDYILMNDFNSPLARSLKISSIPRHIIIDKEGKLVSRDAPSPDEEKLKSYLLKLAKE